MKLLFFLDEGQLLASQKNFASKMLQLRHAGISLLINYQNPSTIPVELPGNCDCHLAFQSTDGRDRDTLARTLGLNLEQKEFLARLNPGACICFLPRSRWKQPFLASVPRIAIAQPGQDLSADGVEWLKQFPWNPLKEEVPAWPSKEAWKNPATRSGPSTQAPEKGEELSPNAVKLLVNLALKPTRTKTEHYLDLELHARIGVGAMRELLSKAIVEEWELVRSGRGAKPVFVAILAPGMAELRKRGIPVPERLVKGGFAHWVYAKRYIGDFARRNGFSIEFEKKFGEKFFDAFLTKPGISIGVEICLSMPASWNCEAALRALRGADGLTELWVCAENKSFLEEIRGEVERRDSSNLREKLKYKFLGELWSKDEANEFA